MKYISLITLTALLGLASCSHFSKSCCKENNKQNRLAKITVKKKRKNATIKKSCDKKKNQKECKDHCDKKLQLKRLRANVPHFR